MDCAMSFLEILFEQTGTPLQNNRLKKSLHQRRAATEGRPYKLFPAQNSFVVFLL